MVLKWYLNSQTVPIYQWIPPSRPQGLGAMRGKIDLDFEISKETSFYAKKFIVKGDCLTRVDLAFDDMYGYINREKYTFCVIKSLEHLKSCKNRPVLYLGLKLTIHVIKSQINLVRQYL
jgi:hypothetical protein